MTTVSRRPVEYYEKQIEAFHKKFANKKPSADNLKELAASELGLAQQIAIYEKRVKLYA